MCKPGLSEDRDGKCGSVSATKYQQELGAHSQKESVQWYRFIFKDGSKNCICPAKRALDYLIREYLGIPFSELSLLRAVGNGSC